MYNTKQQIDSHVSQIFQRQRSDAERKKHGFKFASLYVRIKEYEIAARYLEGFLQVNADFYKAYSLRGEICEQLGQPLKAIEAYKRSLEIDGSQKDILLKICELYCRMDIEPDLAKYWAEKLEEVYPKHELVLRLREKIYLTTDTEENTKELENLYSTELRKRPQDGSTLIKLLRLYIDQGRVNEAFTIAVKEEKAGAQANNIEWYQCLLDIYQEYKQDSGHHVNGTFHTHLLWAQSQLVALCLEKAKVLDCLEILLKFDQTLLSVVQDVSCRTDQWTVFQQEMQAQLYFLSGTLLLKKAKEVHLDWRQASTLAAPCFMFSYSIQAPNKKAAWYVQAAEDDRKWYQLWYKMACFRACQSGHMIKILSGTQTREWMNQVEEELCNTQGKSHLFEVLFEHTFVHASKEDSFIYNNSQFTTFNPRQPTEQELELLDQDTEDIKPESLHHMLWKALQRHSTRDKAQPNYKLHLFDDIKYGNLQLDTAAPHTLCRLDIESFLCASVHDVSHSIQTVIHEPGVPPMLPVAISNQLGSQEQNKWWSAAYHLVNNIKKDRQSELRHMLQLGLEKIRLVGNHGLDATTMIHLARTLAQQLQQESKTGSHDVSLADIVDEQNALQARVEHYWKGAIKVLEKRQSGKSTTLPTYRLFSNRDNELSDEDVDILLEEARYNLALVAMETNEYEEAIKIFQKVSWPEAAFEEGQCYKRLAEQATAHSFDSMDDEGHNHQEALLEKAMDCFKKVLDLLGAEHKNPLYGKAGDEYEEVARSLESLAYQPDVIDQSLNYERPSVLEHIGRSTPSLVNVLSQRRSLTPRVSSLSQSLIQSTPISRRVSEGYSQTLMSGRRHQPSPDRLDAQLQTLSRSNKDIIEEFKKSRKSLQRLESRVDALDESNRKKDDLLDGINQRLKQHDALEESNRKKDDLLISINQRHDVEMLKMCENYEKEKKVQTEELNKLCDLVQSVQLALKESQRTTAQSLLDMQKSTSESLQEVQNMAATAAATAAASVSQQNQAAQMVLPPQPQVQLPQHLQHAQVLPPGAMSPAMYGGALRAQRPMMSQQYPATYGAGYSDFDLTYMQRFPQQFPVMPQQYGMAGHELQNQQREFMMAGTEEYDDNGYEEEESTCYEDEQTIRRRGMKQPGVRGTVSQSSPVRAQQPSQIPPPMYPMYSPPAGHIMPGPGFFSTAADRPMDLATPRIPKHPVIAGQPPTSATVQKSAGSVPGDQAVSVSGANLFMLPNGQQATSFPLNMPNKSPGSIAGVVVKSPTKRGEEDGEGTDGEPATPETSFTDFKPLVSLPEVKTETGEENEIALFNNRAKLFRFIEKQWKERGTGTMKILHNKEMGTVRILMRRDQVLKVCANHCIKTDTGIDYKTPEDLKTLTWRATDYTEEEPRLEQFCCRFKTPDIAAEFKQAFEKAQEIAKNAGTPQKAGTRKSGMQDPAAIGKPAVKDSPMAAVGTITAPASSVAVSASSVAAPASTAPAVSITSSSFQFGSSSFGAKQSTPASDILKSMASKLGNDASSKSNEPSKTVGGFTFNTSAVIKVANDTELEEEAVKPQPAETKDAKVNPFASFSFSPSKHIVSSEATTVSPAEPIFGSSMQSPLSFSGLSKSRDYQGFPGNKLTPKSLVITDPKVISASGAEDDDDHIEEFEPDVDFKPVVTLPTDVEITTGEENEEKLFGERAKLFRHDPDLKKWKERGIGELKIMKHKETCATRILMRREKVLVICANHNIICSMKLLPMHDSDKAWCWFAQDYSEDEMKAEQFAAKFKNKDMAIRFSNVFTECVKQTGTDEETAGEKSAVTTTGNELQSLSDKFKAKPGTWECEDCYVSNKSEAKHCIACETLRPGEKDDTPQVPAASSITLGTAGGFKFSGQSNPPFAFGNSATQPSSTAPPNSHFGFQSGTGFGTVPFGSFMQQPKEAEGKEVTPKSPRGEKKKEEKTPIVSLSEKFKAKPGTWECEACYVPNKSEAKHCIACDALRPGEKDDTPQVPAASSITLGTAGGFKFSAQSNQPYAFGNSATQPSSTAPPNSFGFQSDTGFGTVPFGSFMQQPKEVDGKEVAPKSQKEEKKKDEQSAPIGSLSDAFKAKPGEWECESCYVRNKPEVKKCSACETMKPGEKEDEPDPSSSTTTFSSLKPGPSGGFTFGQQSSAAMTSFGQKTDTTSGGFNFGTSFAVTKETSVAKNSSSSDKESTSGHTFGSSSHGKFSFAGVTPVKQISSRSLTPKTPTSPGEDGYYVNQEGEDDHIFFAPVVKLPDNVEITTGEEDEDLLYYHRAKLFRFFESQWKERGVGEVRILRHRQSNKARLLMRREQVLKICMNHVILKELELKAMVNAKGKAWVWYTVDFAEDEQSYEQFAIKFATEDIASAFKEAFNQARDDPKSMPVMEHVPETKHSKSSGKTPVKETVTESPVIKNAETEAKPSALSLFSFKSPVSMTKPAETPIFGFEIDKNKNSDKNTNDKPSPVFGSGPVFGGHTVFGGSPKMPSSDRSKAEADGGLLAKLLAEPTKDASIEPVALDYSDSDVLIVRDEEIAESEKEKARKWQLPDGFYSYEGRPPCRGCLGCLTDQFDFSLIGSQNKVKVPSRKAKTSKKQTTPTDQTKIESDSTSSAGGLMFGNTSSNLGDFASLAAKSSDAFSFGKSSDSKPFSFAGAGRTLFGKSPKTAHEDGGDDDDCDVENDPDIHFEPIVQLPEVVDLTTGEEGEEKVFSHRAKLYRYDNQQWKERAIGEMKILKNQETGRYRLLMRREQVLKVACNHYMTVDMELKPLQTSETAWCWYAVDYTETDPKNEQFALRFKTRELAAAFKDKFDECQSLLRKADKTGTSSPQDGATASRNQSYEEYECESGEEELVSLFSKRATMYYRDGSHSTETQVMGDLEVMYDDDVCGARIRMKSDQDKLVCNHVICRNYNLNLNEKKKNCEWTAKDFSTDDPIQRSFRVQFSSTNALMEFHKIFDEGVNMANDSEIDEVSDMISLTREMDVPQIAGQSEQES